MRTSISSSEIAHNKMQLLNLLRRHFQNQINNLVDHEIIILKLRQIQVIDNQRYELFKKSQNTGEGLKLFGVNDV